MSEDVNEQDPWFFRKSVLNMTGSFEFGGQLFSTEEVIEAITPILTDERMQRIDEVLKHRTFNMIPVMENIYDRGNISAVMRSAEAFGFLRCHIIEAKDASFKAANRVTKGADKWMDTRVFTTAAASISELKSEGYQVFATSLEASKPLETVDFTRKTAIILGNEKEGVSSEMQKLCDGHVVIPMKGFSQSFNISVAAALIFYHAAFQRQSQLGGGDLNDLEVEQVRANYFLRCLEAPEKILLRWKNSNLADSPS